MLEVVVFLLVWLVVDGGWLGLYWCLAEVAEWETLGLLVFVDVLADSSDPLFGSQLEDGRHQEHSRPGHDAGAPLASVESHSLGESWEELDGDELDGEDECEEEQEVWVVEEGLEHVEVSSTDLSAVDHVEGLETHEHVEDVGEVSLLRKGSNVGQIVSSVHCAVGDRGGEVSWHGEGLWSATAVFWESGNHVTEQHHDGQEDEVPEGDSHDLSPHNW